MRYIDRIHGIWLEVTIFQERQAMASAKEIFRLIIMSQKQI